LINGYNTWEAKGNEKPEYKYHHGAKDNGKRAYI
jgi:hypothetical protein